MKTTEQIRNAVREHYSRIAENNQTNDACGCGPDSAAGSCCASKPVSFEEISLARANAEKGGFAQVGFRLGEIEYLPVADQSVDVIISNCVINLSPEKQQVFNEAYRVLKKGGRLAISDVVATATIPEYILSDLELYSACVSGASTVAELEEMLQKSGFSNVRIRPKDESKEYIKDWTSGENLADFILSASIEAIK